MTVPFLKPDDSDDVVYESFGPFAHIEGEYEWCRIRSPTHGVFDTFIVLGKTTAHPAKVYVASMEGQLFMLDRYPECRTIRVPEGRLAIDEAAHGRTVHGVMESTEGPVRAADMTFYGDPEAVPKQVPYGGEGRPVWGSKRFTCWGVDLALDAEVDGFLVDGKGRETAFEKTAGIVTLGSFARIAPLADEA